MNDLTEKQLSVLRLKAQGFTDKAIAKELGIGLEAVKDRVTRIRCGLGVTGDFCQVVLKAERAGLLAGVEV